MSNPADWVLAILGAWGCLRAVASIPTPAVQR
jgi:hypothetical protein